MVSCYVCVSMFFFKQKTAYEMRISDWSSDVCSSDLSRFPDTQFIFTTHDEVWLRHMKSEGIIKSKNAAQFRTWTVEAGPTEWTTNSVWDEIDGHLTKNDVSAAAAALRRYQIGRAHV